MFFKKKPITPPTNPQLNTAAALHGVTMANSLGTATGTAGGFLGPFDQSQLQQYQPYKPVPVMNFPPTPGLVYQDEKCVPIPCDYCDSKGAMALSLMLEDGSSLAVCPSCMKKALNKLLGERPAPTDMGKLISDEVSKLKRA